MYLLTALTAVTDLITGTTGSLTALMAPMEEVTVLTALLETVMEAQKDLLMATMEAVTAATVAQMVLEALLATMEAVTAAQVVPEAILVAIMAAVPAVQVALEGPATAPGLKEMLMEMATAGESTTIGSLTTRSPSLRSTPTRAVTAETGGESRHAATLSPGAPPCSASWIGWRGATST